MGKTRRFVPKAFYSASQLEKIVGLYLPYWLADTTAAIDIAGKGINSRTWITGNVEYHEMKEYEIERQGSIDVNHVANRPAIRSSDA